MPLHNNIKQLIQDCPGLSQSWIANNTSLNRGQFNRWLTTGENLSQGKITEAIQAILGFIEQNDALKTRFQNHIIELKGYAPLKASQAQENPASPDQAVPTDHPSYVARTNEQTLYKALQMTPFYIGLIAGPKLGKSSLLNQIRPKLPRHRILLVEFVQQAEFDPLVQIEQAAKQQLDTQLPRLRSWPDLPVWLNKNLLGKKPLTLFLCDLHKIDPEHQHGMQDGLHLLINQASQQASFENLNIICSYDESADVLQNSNMYSSSFWRDLRPYHLSPFNQNEQEQLIHQITQYQNSELDQACDFAWAYFGGHPYLNHYFAALLAEQPSQQTNYAQIVVQMQTGVENKLIKPFMHNLAASAKSELTTQLAPINRGEKAFTLTLSRASKRFLLDSGLFVMTDNDSLDSDLRCTSAWIQDRFIQIIPTL